MSKRSLTVLFKRYTVGDENLGEIWTTFNKNLASNDLEYKACGTREYVTHLCVF